MRNYFYFLLLVVFLTASCKSDGTATVTNTDSDNTEQISESSENSTLDMSTIDVSGNEKVELDVKMDEAIKEEELAKKILVESKNKEVSKIAEVEDKNKDTKLKGKSEDQKKKEAEMKMEATKKMIDSSVNKGKTCEQILKEQENFIEEFAKSKDRKVILKMAKAKNDPFFAECMEAAEFASKIEELTTRLETIMDQE